MCIIGKYICNQNEEMWILCSANTTRPFEKYLSNCKDRSELEAHPGEQTQGNMDEVVDMDISDSEVFVIMLIFHCLTILNIVMNIFLHSLNLKFQEEGGPDQVEDMDISDSEVVVIMLIFYCLTIFNIVTNIFLHPVNLKFQEEGGAEQVSEEEAPACPICLATFNISDEVK